jgi:hypothetical protein
LDPLHKDKYDPGRDESVVKIVYGEHAGKLGRLLKFNGGRIDTMPDNKKFWVEIDDKDSPGGKYEMKVSGLQVQPVQTVFSIHTLPDLL